MITNGYGDIQSCKMHDLIHDLAQLVAGEECIISNLKAEKVVERTHHVAFDSLADSLPDISACLLRADRMRTLHLRIPSPLPYDHVLKVNKHACDTLISSFKCLCALNLSYSNIQEVPNSIGKLKHLRFLNLSKNFDIKLLPASITKLQNLQTLILHRCDGLKELPEDTRNLISLRHLVLSRCESLTHMPHGLGKLTAIRTLNLYNLGKKEGSVSKPKGGIGDLHGLDELRGELCIKGLEHLRSSPSKAEAANLQRKEHLRSLELQWDPEVGDDSEQEIINAERLLETLQPHKNLKYLVITGYAGVRLSSWVSFLSYLVSITISNCKWCEQIPSLDRFPHLKRLYLKNLSALEYISNDGSDVSSFSLESLLLGKLPKLRGWRRMRETVTTEHEQHHQLPLFPSFPCLSNLSINNCPMMSIIPYVAPGSQTTPSSSSPFSTLSKLNYLRLEGLEELEYLPEEWLKNVNSLMTLNILECHKLRISMSQLFQHLTALEDLEISNCRELISNEDEEGAQCLGPTTLRYLSIRNVTSLVSLPRELRHVTTLQGLYIMECPSLVSLPEWIGDLTSLQLLWIINCPNLISLPEGMSRLTSLRRLTIAQCPCLEEKCVEGTGEDWPKIAHIPEFSNQMDW